MTLVIAAAGKRQSVRPAGGQRDRGGFDDRGAAAAAGHGCQQPMQLRSFGSRQPPGRVHDAGSVVDVDARHQSGREAETVEEQLREPRRGALAVRAGHADEPEVPCRVAGVPSSGDREGRLRVRHLQVAHVGGVAGQIALVDHRTRAPAHGVGYEAVAVILAAGAGDEQRAGAGLARIVADRVDRAGRPATDARRSDAVRQIRQVRAWRFSPITHRGSLTGIGHAVHGTCATSCARGWKGACLHQSAHSLSSARTGPGLRLTPARQGGSRRQAASSAVRRGSRRTPRRWRGSSGSSAAACGTPRSP